MREPSEKELKSFENWPQLAEKKWRYYFLYGSIFWGLPVGFITHLFDIDFTFTDFQWPQLMMRLLVFIIFGLAYGAFIYRSKTKRYNQIKHLLP